MVIALTIDVYPVAVVKGRRVQLFLYECLATADKVRVGKGESREIVVGLLGVKSACSGMVLQEDVRVTGDGSIAIFLNVLVVRHARFLAVECGSCRSGRHREPVGSKAWSIEKNERHIYARRTVRVLDHGICRLLRLGFWLTRMYCLWECTLRNGPRIALRLRAAKSAGDRDLAVDRMHKQCAYLQLQRDVGISAACAAHEYLWYASPAFCNVDHDLRPKALHVLVARPVSYRLSGCCTMARRLETASFVKLIDLGRREDDGCSGRIVQMIYVERGPPRTWCSTMAMASYEI